MKQIMVMTEKKSLSFAAENNEKFAVIRICSNSERKTQGLLPYGKDCFDALEIIYNDDIEEEFNYGMSEKIIRFCKWLPDEANLIITCKNDLTAAYNVKAALDDCYDTYYESYQYDEIGSVYKIIRLKYQESLNWLVNVLSPEDYCKKVIEYTSEQIRELICGKNMEPYNPYHFFWNRICSIYLNNGTYFTFDFELIESCFGNIVIPDINEIEYVVFKGIPEFASRDSFDDDMDYLFDDHYGIINNYDQKYVFDSISGAVPAEEYKLPDKYKNYRLIQREWVEFTCDENGAWCPPTMEHGYAGMIGAEEYLSEKTDYKPGLVDIPLYHPEDLPIYSEKFLEICDTILEVMELAEIAEFNKPEYMCANIAYIYSGLLCNCGHCENMSIVREIFLEKFNRDDTLPQFEKVWKIADNEPIISNDPIDMLCIAIYSLIITARSEQGIQLSSEFYKNCLENAFEITQGNSELSNAIIMTGAFAGIYCQNSN